MIRESIDLALLPYLLCRCVFWVCILFMGSSQLIREAPSSTDGSISLYDCDMRLVYALHIR
jgi:hypothetical protein